MEFGHILSYMGVFLFISGLLGMVPVSVALYYNEDYFPFLVSAIPSMVVGWALARLPRKSLGFGDAMLLTAVSLIVISLFNSLSYFITFDGTVPEVLVNGYFESVSGFTTTGFTTLSREKLNPASPLYSHSLVFKRSLNQWTGGLGIVVLFLSILVGRGISSIYLYRVGAGVKQITPTVEQTARIMIRVCLFYTLAGAILLYLTGMEPFYAVNAAMGSISTGGFPYSSDGLHANSWGKVVMALLMIAGSIPFTLHYSLLGGKVKDFFRNVEVRSLFILLPTAVVLIGGLQILYGKLGYSALDMVFDIISVMTTTGYSIMSTSDWHHMGDLPKFLFAILMFIGTGAGSTSGGLKLIRLTVLVRAFGWTVRRSSLPQSAVYPLKVDHHVFDDEELAAVSVFFFTFAAMILVGAVFISLCGVGIEGEGVGLMDSVFVSTSSMATASPTTLDIASQPLVVKLVLIMQMIAGRLEIFPLITLVSYAVKSLRKSNKKTED